MVVGSAVSIAILAAAAVYIYANSGDTLTQPKEVKLQDLKTPAFPQKDEGES